MDVEDLPDLLTGEEASRRSPHRQRPAYELKDWRAIESPVGPLSETGSDRFII